MGDRYKNQSDGIHTDLAFLFIYDKNHPHNNTYGGSIKVIPINPNAKEIKTIAKEHGRPCVPYVRYSDYIGEYLCTIYSQSIIEKTKMVFSAVVAVNSVADWRCTLKLVFATREFGISGATMSVTDV